MTVLLYHPESDCMYWGDPDDQHDGLVTEIDPCGLPAYTQIPAGLGVSTVLPDMDFETYSEAGYWFDPYGGKSGLGRWKFLPGTPKGTTSGLAAVGAARYAEHPSTEVLSLTFDLKDGLGPELWLPGMPAPQRLIDHFARGGLMEAHNSMFERLIWHHVCHNRMGWPDVPAAAWRCSASKSRAFSIPGALGKAGAAIGANIQKDKDGVRLLNKFSKPRSPTKSDPRLRIRPDEDPEGVKLYSYNYDDIRAEADLSARVPDLPPAELEVWQVDQAINWRGVHVDSVALANCKAIIEQAWGAYTDELKQITGGVIGSASEVAAIRAWLQARGVQTSGLDADAVEEALGRPHLPDDCRRVLEIRQALASSSVKKVYALDRRLCSDSRVRDIFLYSGADRTARWAGQGPQPQNLPSSGPNVSKCVECGRRHSGKLDACPWCLAPDWASGGTEWGPEAAQDALDAIASRDLATVERIMGDAVGAVAGSLRALFTAAPGHDLICSDFSAIEAVGLAALAGEEWRLEVFRTHGKIYEASAAAITGIPFEEFMAHAGYTDLSIPRWWEAPQTGQNHQLRKKIGKVAELASGYGGWIGAWKAFGADKHIGDDKEIKKQILAWRDASPMIVEFWGGQVRKAPDAWEFKHECYGLEGAAVRAILNPGQCYSYRDITYGVKDDVLYCRLPSGRFLKYHQPRLYPTQCRMSKLDIWQITYMGLHQQSKNWVRLDTYGGKLAENVTQAACRDIMAHALVGLERAGYRPVLHVHDEPCGEVPKGWGSIEEFERIMATPPEWCKDWPIKAAGGWRGLRYRKD